MRYAVAVFFDNELQLEIVEAIDWKEALKQAFDIDIDKENDKGWMFIVKELKND